jgi:hypothetical protein
MLESNNRPRSPLITVPEENSSPIRLPKERKTIFQPPPIDPLLRLKWGLALLGEEKAKEYLAWLQARLDADSQ